MKNHFKSFSLPQIFSINLGELEKKYLEFQKEFHPDKSSSEDISKSIEINEAYKVLSDDFLRASHLLELQNIDILNNERATKVDSATLLHVLELQEEISEITEKSEIEALRKEINGEFKDLISKAVELLEASKIADAAQNLIKAKYLKKSLEDLKIRKRNN
jgi:Fe-S protein assembly co-chaperone HscB